MVLGYWGIQSTEVDLARQLGTTSMGTPGSRLVRLSSPTMQVFFGPFTLTMLKRHLEQRQPVIALVRTMFLDYWHDDLAHAVVVVGSDDDGLLLNDPAFDVAPQRASIDGFLAAWCEFDYLCASIIKR
jgi:ABC-type bacteriocin/lantibiotic exporter with double-glycine peptidase domain